jgi:hypothetical protein
MQMARIGSKTTYSRCMKELDQWGYISYSPSGNWHTGSQVACIRFDSDSRPGSGTGTGTRSGTGTDLRTGTPFLNTNNYKQAKQVAPQIFQNGERKNHNGFSPYHVNNDKDYSEPL